MPAQQPDPGRPRWALTASTHVELLGQPGRAEPVGDLQPRRVVGERDVLVAQLDRGHHHLLDRRPAVGPVRVGVQVAAQGRAHVRAARRPAVRRPSPGPRGTSGRGRRAPPPRPPRSPCRSPRARAACPCRPARRARRGRGRAPGRRAAERLDLVGLGLASARAGTRSGAARRRDRRAGSGLHTSPFSLHSPWRASVQVTRAIRRTARACPPQHSAPVCPARSTGFRVSSTRSPQGYPQGWRPSVDAVPARP